MGLTPRQGYHDPNDEMYVKMPQLPIRYLLQALVSVKTVLLSLARICQAQIPNSDVGEYPSGVLTLIAASWFFFTNSTSTLYGMMPQYWLLPGLQTAKKQHRDNLRQVRCCQKNCYNENPAAFIDQADKFAMEYKNKGVELLERSKQIVASGSWSFSVLAEASEEEVRRGRELLLASVGLRNRREEKRWISEYQSWEADVNAVEQKFWTYDSAILTPKDLLNNPIVVKTVDSITIRVGSRRRTMNIGKLASLLTHSVAAAAARENKKCIVFEAMLISRWAEEASIHSQGPQAAHQVPARPWAKPVLVPAFTLKLRAATPARGANIAYEPIETHGLWIYIVLITAARVVISSATALGSSGSLWFAVFTGLYLTNPSAAGSFGRESYDARADSGLMSGEGFYMNFNRSTMTGHVKLHDRLESVSVILSLISVVSIRLFKLKLRSLLGYSPWVASAPWQMCPGIVLSIWATLIHTAELIAEVGQIRRRKTWKSSNVLISVLWKIFIVGSGFACTFLGLASVTTAYGGLPRALSLRWAAYGVAEFHSWHVGMHQLRKGVDGPDMWFAATATLSAIWGATILAVAADPGDSIF